MISTLVVPSCTLNHTEHAINVLTQYMETVGLNGEKQVEGESNQDGFAVCVSMFSVRATVSLDGQTLPMKEQIYDLIPRLRATSSSTAR